MREYFSIPNQEYTSEIEISKSRFLGFARSVSTQDEAEEFVKNLKKKFADARHVCFAYKLNSTAKMSDDGEPSGTAGRPILSVIENKGLENVVVAVVRYFGGIKLGAGGLLRAYVESATATLTQAPKVKWESAFIYSMTLSFSEFKTFEHSIQNRKIKVLKTEFSDMVRLSLVAAESEKIENATLQNCVMWSF